MKEFVKPNRGMDISNLIFRSIPFFKKHPYRDDDNMTFNIENDRSFFKILFLNP